MNKLPTTCRANTRKLSSWKNLMLFRAPQKCWIWLWPLKASQTIAIWLHHCLWQLIHFQLEVKVSGIMILILLQKFSDSIVCSICKDPKICYCTILKRENLVLKVTNRSGKKKMIVKRKQTKMDENSTTPENCFLAKNLP